MIRLIDFIGSLVGLILLAPLVLTIAIILWMEHRKPLFIQQRVGQNQRPFTLVKFRTMSSVATDLPTHEVANSLITKSGKFLRRSKLDELPQLWNVLKGEMSLVGPRPCLPTQLELINAREERKVYLLKPGITGPAQVKNIDMSTPLKLAEEDAKLIGKLNLLSYLKYIVMTLSGSGQGDKVLN